MSFSLDNSSPTRDLDSERVFFKDLSEDAQAKALEFKEVQSEFEANWDVMPMEYLSQPKSDLDQDEIDMAGLGGIGYYREKAQNL